MLLDAGAAPRSPEVDDRDLALGEVSGMEARHRLAVVEQLLKSGEIRLRHRAADQRLRQLGGIAGRQGEREQARHGDEDHQRDEGPAALLGWRAGCYGYRLAAHAEPCWFPAWAERRL